MIKFCVTLGFLALNGCLFSSDGDGAVDPGSNAAQFRMIPNDKAISDSIAANLAVGVVIPGHPNGSYSLSFPAGSGDIPDLRLYRLYEQSNGYYGYTTDQVVEGQLQDSDWVYEFSSDFTGMVNWLTVLEQNGKRYKKNISDVQLSATGAYSDTLSFNLWVAGKYVAPAGDETPEELADSLLAGFREYYGPTGIVVDTVYTLYAVDHPLIGDEFDSTQTISASGLEDRFDSLGYGLEKPYSKALDIVLVYKFDNDSVLGLSPLFGCNLKAGESGAVVVSTHRINDANKLAGAEVQKIITTMVHEVGHFFGLRHTTVTTDDMEASNDYS
ncbi:MAG TPA: hypothetical protein VLM37_13350, partial [Fibrobacteraceae bacterium]|nr:hypothetical protein [Fibrobacteraceae bacterium]